MLVNVANWLRCRRLAKASPVALLLTHGSSKAVARAGPCKYQRRRGRHGPRRKRVEPGQGDEEEDNDSGHWAAGVRQVVGSNGVSRAESLFSLSLSIELA